MPPTTSSVQAGGVQPFHGYVDTTGDALRLIEAARRGLLPRITRRLNELERRSMIRSGAVFIFSVEESGIRRWTEGLSWSQSRIAGNFLIYREVTERGSLRVHASSETPEPRHGPTDTQIAFKPDGLIKKTITVKVDGSDHHLISYFTQDDVRSGRLQRPTSRPDLMVLEIPAELLQSTNFRYPPRLETGRDGNLIQIRDSDEIDNQREGMASPESPSNRTRWTTGEESSGLRHVDFPRSPIHSPDTFYRTQSRLGHDEAPYLSSSSRVQPDMVDLMSATAPVQAPHAHFQSSLSVDGMPFPRTASSWPSPEHVYGGAATSPVTPMTHHSQGRHDQTTVNDVYLHGSRNWAPHVLTSSHVPHGFQPNMATGDIGGSPSSPIDWPSSAPAYNGQTHSSAPAATFSMASNLPAGRNRDHLRTRSFPTPTSWPTNSAIPYYQGAHDNQLAYTSSAAMSPTLEAGTGSNRGRGEEGRYHQNR